jgi:hypothetical protein
VKTTAGSRPATGPHTGRIRPAANRWLQHLHFPIHFPILVTPFPDWVPTEVLQAAQKLTEKEAASQLAVVLSLSS